MYKTNVTYENFDGEEITETLHFNLTKAEIIKLQGSVANGYDAKIKEVLKSKNNNAILALFEDLILRSYGEVNEAGRFVKNSMIREAFVASEAYSELFVKLLNDEKEQLAFFYGIMPKDAVNAAKAEIEKAGGDYTKLIEE